MARHSIGDVCRHSGLSHDTLRYYEKIGLLPRIARDPGGRRCYDDKDLSRLAFIQRAQAVNFTLDEIRNLLRFRDNPVGAKPEVLALTQRKYQQVLGQLDQLEHLKSELSLLLNLCRSGSGETCPIIEGFSESSLR